MEKAEESQRKGKNGAPQGWRRESNDATIDLAAGFPAAALNQQGMRAMESLSRFASDSSKLLL